MLGALISMIERPVGLDVELRAMGARHHDYGVQDEHYASVGAALLFMLGEVLGEQFTPPVRAAWEGLYSVVAETMQRGAQQATGVTHP
jgi:hemoglobin-like flavoprotein